MIEQGRDYDKKMEEMRVLAGWSVAVFLIVILTGVVLKLL